MTHFSAFPSHNCSSSYSPYLFAPLLTQYQSLKLDFSIPFLFHLVLMTDRIFFFFFFLLMETPHLGTYFSLISWKFSIFILNTNSGKISSSELSLKQSPMPSLTKDFHLLLNPTLGSVFGLYFICLHSVFPKPDTELLQGKKHLFIYYPRGLSEYSRKCKCSMNVY